MAILTISREYGSGGKEVARVVAEATGYGTINRKQVLEQMRSIGEQWEEKAKYFDENHPDVWERREWSYNGFVALNQSYILDSALKGNVIILGRGGNFLLRKIPFVLSVRTIAPLEKRVQNVMRWLEETNTENARYLIEKADKEMAGAVYVIYGSQWDDPKQYDMVFDTSVQSYDEIAGIIVSELSKKERFNTEENRKILALRALGARIKADLAIDPTLSLSSIDVDPKEDRLVEYGLILKAVVHNQEDAGRIEETARRLAGEVAIECNIQYRWRPRFG